MNAYAFPNIESINVVVYGVASGQAFVYRAELENELSKRWQWDRFKLVFPGSTYAENLIAADVERALVRMWMRA